MSSFEIRLSDKEPEKADDALRPWLCEQAVKDGETLLKEQDAVRQRHLSLAMSLTGWAQPVAVVLIGAFASTELPWRVRIALGGTLVCVAKAMLDSFRVLRTRNWGASAHRPSGWLANLDNTARYTRAEVMAEQARRLQSIFDRNKEPLAEMEKFLSRAQKMYLLSPWAGLAAGVAAMMFGL